MAAYVHLGSLRPASLIVQMRDMPLSLFGFGVGKAGLVTSVGLPTWALLGALAWVWCRERAATRMSPAAFSNPTPVISIPGIPRIVRPGLLLCNGAKEEAADGQGL